MWHGSNNTRHSNFFGIIDIQKYLKSWPTIYFKCFYSYLKHFHCPLQVNLRYGVVNPLSRTGTESDTCTACAGTMILEFAALSRLSGDPIFEVNIQQVFLLITDQDSSSEKSVLRSYSTGILCRNTLGKLWTSFGKSGKEEVTWSALWSISTTETGFAEVRLCTGKVVVT